MILSTTPGYVSNAARNKAWATMLKKGTLPLYSTPVRFTGERGHGANPAFVLVK